MPFVPDGHFIGFDADRFWDVKRLNAFSSAFSDKKSDSYVVMIYQSVSTNLLLIFRTHHDPYEGDDSVEISTVLCAYDARDNAQVCSNHFHFIRLLVEREHLAIALLYDD
jgi:hypothetical protein